MNRSRLQTGKTAIVLVAATLLLGACHQHYRTYAAPHLGYYGHGKQLHTYKHGYRHGKHLHKPGHKGHRGERRHRKRHWRGNY